MPGTDNKDVPVCPFGILSWEGNGREKKRGERKMLRETERERKAGERDGKSTRKEKERRRANWLFSHPVSSFPGRSLLSPRFKAGGVERVPNISDLESFECAATRFVHVFQNLPSSVMRLYARGREKSTWKVKESNLSTKM